MQKFNCNISGQEGNKELRIKNKGCKEAIYYNKI